MQGKLQGDSGSKLRRLDDVDSAGFLFIEGQKAGKGSKFRGERRRHLTGMPVRSSPRGNLGRGTRSATNQLMYSQEILYANKTGQRVKSLKEKIRGVSQMPFAQ